MATGNKHSVNDVKFGRRDFLWVCRPERRQANALTGWPQSRRKNISCAFQSHTLTFPLQQKVNAIMTFIKGIPHQLQQYNSSPPHSDLVRNSRDFVHLKPKTQVEKIQNICKYLNDKLKLLCYNFSPRLHRTAWVFHVLGNPRVFQVRGHTD